MVRYEDVRSHNVEIRVSAAAWGEKRIHPLYPPSCSGVMQLRIEFGELTCFPPRTYPRTRFRTLPEDSVMVHRYIIDENKNQLEEFKTNITEPKRLIHLWVLHDHMGVHLYSYLVPYKSFCGRSTPASRAKKGKTQCTRFVEFICLGRKPEGPLVLDTFSAE